MTTKSTKKTAPARAAKSTTKKAAPKSAAKPKTSAAPTMPPKADAPTSPEAPPRDPRLPKPGTVLHRAHKGKAIEVTVLDHGFEYDGRVWRSLSAIAREVTGVVWNGYLWAGLVKRVAKSTPVAKDGAK